MTTFASLHELVADRMPGWRLVDVSPFSVDEGTSSGDGTAKGTGYGRPLRLHLRDDAGQERTLVWHTVRADGFGHERRADRAQNILLAYDSFGRIPRHVAALDVGAMLPEGRLVSLRDAGELYLVTSYAAGVPYADDLRRVAATGAATALDLERCDVLARYLAELHAGQAEGSHRRAVRDLIGSGEGIFGVIDAYGSDDPVAAPARLRALERRAAEWRWALRAHEGRVTRTHGDFHPFNVLFDGRAELAVLDASRGVCGDPADDVTCMALNYVFFALEHPGSWPGGLRPLLRRFWSTYLAARPDAELASVAPPFVAWRCLVMACPRFYPDLSPGARDRILLVGEHALDRRTFDIDDADHVMF